MNKKLYIILSFFLSLIVLNACKDDDFSVDKNDNILKFTISMPKDASNTRTTISAIQGEKNFNIKWKEGDKIHLFCEQKNKIYDIGKVAVYNISEDGLSAEFSTKPSTNINLNKAFVLYGVYGVDASFSDDKGIYYDISPIVGIPLDEFAPPLHFSVEIKAKEKQNMIEFDHLGTYEFVHIKNESSSSIKVKSPKLTTAQAQNELWYHNPNNNSSIYYYPKNNNVNAGTLITGHKTANAINILPNNSKSFVNWYRVKPINIRGIRLLSQINDTPQYTATKSELKHIILENGKGYHIYAIWNGTKLKYIGEVEPFELELSSVDLEVGKTKDISITKGKALRIENDREDIVVATIKDAGKKISLEAKAEGNANIKVYNENEYICLEIRVNKAQEDDIPDPNIPWENISTDDYELSADGLTLLKWKNKNTQHLDMNRDPQLKKVTSIGREAFSYCEILRSINISSSVTSIGVWAFFYCRSLTNINIPSSVTGIGDYAFCECRSLTNINIPNLVTRIGANAFAYCTSLRNINIPNSVTSIENWAFSDCTSLTNINIPNSVTSIGDYAFSDCTSLTNINIPSSVTSIGANAFSVCTSLRNIDIPNSVISIGDSAFASCINITSIDIPSSVTIIGYLAFNYCKSLNSITIRSPKIIKYSSGILNNTPKLENIYVPANLVEGYKNAEGWRGFADKIKAIED